MTTATRFNVLFPAAHGASMAFSGVPLPRTTREPTLALYEAISGLDVGAAVQIRRLDATIEGGDPAARLTTAQIHPVKMTGFDRKVL